jgi:hypothetical protein
MFDVAPNFDEQPDINDILTDEKLPPEKRLELLVSPSVPKEAWEEARKNTNEKAWFSEQTKNKSPKRSK